MGDSGYDRLHNRGNQGTQSPIGMIGPTGWGSSILSSRMSIAIAEYTNNKRDIVLATDTRWVRGSIGNFTVEDDDGIKSIDLTKQAAIAFTGHACLMAEIVGGLYNDGHITEEPKRDALKRLESSGPHDLEMSLEEIVDKLNYIVPMKRNLLGLDLDLSIILVGAGRNGPTMYWWAAESEFIGIENPANARPRVRTLPPETSVFPAVRHRADAILNGHGNAIERVRRVLSFLSNDDRVRSVSDKFVIRRMSEQFARL